MNCWDGSERATPVFCAAATENSSCLPILLAHGGDLNQGLHELGLSAVHCATSSNAIHNLNLLLERGAEPNSVLLYRYRTLLFSSVQIPNLTIFFSTDTQPYSFFLSADTEPYVSRYFANSKA